VTKWRRAVTVAGELGETLVNGVTGTNHLTQQTKRGENELRCVLFVRIHKKNYSGKSIILAGLLVATTLQRGQWHCGHE